MDKTEKILEQFHYFNIPKDVDSIYGNWVVSTDGDMVNYLYPYAIFAIHVNDCNWIDKLKKKIWFKSVCETEFQKALLRAKEILNNKETNER